MKMFMIKEGTEVEVVNKINNKVADMEIKSNIYFSSEAILVDPIKTKKSYYKIKLDCEDLNNEFYAIYVNINNVVNA